jgi:hypothetical protein
MGSVFSAISTGVALVANTIIGEIQYLCGTRSITNGPTERPTETASKIYLVDVSMGLNTSIPVNLSTGTVGHIKDLLGLPQEIINEIVISFKRIFYVFI